MRSNALLTILLALILAPAAYAEQAVTGKTPSLLAPEFWVSNALVMLSSIVGVYLAARASYRNSVHLEIAKAEREGYFLRVALLDELKDNIDYVGKFAAVFVAKQGESWGESLDDFKLQSFVWDTMKHQSITFQIPAEILSAIRRFHDGVAGKVREINKMSHVTPINQAPTISFYGHIGEKMVAPARAIEDAAMVMRKVTIPALERDIASLQASLGAQK
jgi:hypothetical protein